MARLWPEIKVSHVRSDWGLHWLNASTNNCTAQNTNHTPLTTTPSTTLIPPHRLLDAPLVLVLLAAGAVVAVLDVPCVLILLAADVVVAVLDTDEDVAVPVLAAAGVGTASTGPEDVVTASNACSIGRPNCGTAEADIENRQSAMTNAETAEMNVERKRNIILACK